ncbi:MAG TPA: hypothetical protein VFL47_04555, partial [Flavisolibacter sp.]|nr:hypothetical protein [Flavisolibacter sp.]
SCTWPVICYQRFKKSRISQSQLRKQAYRKWRRLHCPISKSTTISRYKNADLHDAGFVALQQSIRTATAFKTAPEIVVLLSKN